MDSRIFIVIIVVLLIVLVFLIFQYIQDIDPVENLCVDIGGVECLEKCEGKLESTDDINLCCVGECLPECKISIIDDIPSCCIGDSCRPLTCEESGGYVCDNVSECDGDYSEISGSICCSNECVKKTTFSSCQEVCPYDFLCDTPKKTVGSFSCCENSCNIQKTSTCNYNKICESFEENCQDCKCNGVVCDSICYENVDDSFSCNEISDNSIISVMLENISSNIKHNVWENGSLIIKNNLIFPVKLSIEVSGADFDIIVNPLDDIELDPSEEYKIDIELKPRKISEYIETTIFGNPLKNIQKSTLTINGIATLLGEDKEIIYSKDFLVYGKNYSICGNNKFSLDGECIDNVYYLHKDCEVGSGCIDGLSWWFLIDQKIKPIGKIKVGYVGLDLNNNLNIAEMNERFNKISDWYQRESIKYTGRDLIDFDIEYIGEFKLKSDLIKDATDPYARDNFNKSDSYKELENFFNFKNYDLVVAFTDKEIKSSIGDAGSGLTVFDNFILQSDKTKEVTAHEMGHVFGCRDIYFIDLLCDTVYKNNLMCNKWGSLEDSDLGVCAAEMGWGDRDGDGILDIEDPIIEENPPSWLTGINIEIESTEVNKTNNQVTAIVVVKDNMGGIITNPDVSFEISTFGTIYHCSLWNFDLKKSFWCSYIPNNLPVDIVITAEYGGFIDKEMITFK